MNEQSFDVSYRAAMDAATAEQNKLFEEAKRLRNRMDQVNEALSALRLLLDPSESDASTSNWARQQFDSTLSVAAVA